MVLLEEAVEIPGLADLDGHFAISVDGFCRGEFGATCIDDHGLGHVIWQSISRSIVGPQPCPDGLVAASRSVTIVVDCPVEIPSFAVDAYVRLVHSQALPDWPVAAKEHLLQHRQQLERAAMDR